MAVDAVEVNENTRAPISTKTTNVVSLAVLSIACLSNLRSRRRRTTAMIKAPVAPMAPPSVGVAMPRKMVPSTRKIRASGGMRTR